MNNPQINVMQQRRSIYALGKNVTQSADAIEALIKEAVRLSPSAFNSQSSRVVTLFGAAHDQLWDIVTNTLRAIVPAENFAPTEQKISSFKAAYGTVLYYEDQDVVKGLQEKFAAYADNFPIWSEHSSAIAQHSVWAALAAEGIGASLQHYNPIIDAEVQKTWNLPASWKLRAQMPFGSIEAPAGERSFMDDAERFRTFK
ncbi:MAG: nitroreductase family protein [Neisseria sp.]|nr:nitroreductase family protein [Neisseria sp.]